MADLETEAARLGIHTLNVSRPAKGAYWVVFVANDSVSYSVSHPIMVEAVRDAILGLEVKEASR